MNLANKLTLARLVMTFVFVGVMLSSVQFADTIALLIFIGAAATDYWDGKIARERNQRTTFGDLFDPLADKVLVLSALMIFATIRFQEPLGASLVPVWAVIAILTRELAVTGLRVLAASRGENIAAGWSGKQKTISQLIAVIVILAGEAFDHDWAERLFAEKVRWLDMLPTVYLVATYIAVAFTIASGIIYFWQHRHLLETQK